MAASPSRLFVGFFPDEATRLAVAAVAERIRPQLLGPGRAVKPGQYHVTLHHLGDYPELSPDRIAAAQSALAQVKAKKFAIRFDVVDSFEATKKPPCVLRCSTEPLALRTCWHQSWALLADAGFAQWLNPGFAPHLTLYYADDVLAEPVWIEPIAMAVGELVLVQSMVGQNQYTRLGSKRLG